MCQLPKRGGKIRHLQLCSALYKAALRTCRFVSLALPCHISRQETLRPILGLGEFLHNPMIIAKPILLKGTSELPPNPLFKLKF